MLPHPTSNTPVKGWVPKLEAFPHHCTFCWNDSVSVNKINPYICMVHIRLGKGIQQLGFESLGEVVVLDFFFGKKQYQLRVQCLSTVHCINL